MKVRGTPWDAPKTFVEPGDFVLVKRPTEGTLDGPSRPHILQVVRKKSSGVVVLQGQDAARIEEQIKNVAPSSLPILDRKIYPERYFSGDPVQCHECGSCEKEESIVLCDQCQDGFHI